MLKNYRILLIATLSSIFIFFTGSTAYSLQCSEILSLEHKISLTAKALKGDVSTELTGELLLKKLRHALKSFKPTKAEPTKEEIKFFASKEGALRLLPVLETDEHSISNTLWVKIEESLFNSPETESSEFVKSVEILFFQYEDMIMGQKHSDKKIKAALKTTGSFVHRKSLVQDMKIREEFLSLLYGREIVLISSAGVLDFFSASNRSDLIEKQKSLMNRSEALSSRIKGHLASNYRGGVEIRNELGLAMFENTEPRAHPSDFSLFDFGPTKQEVITLIDLIGLKETETASLLSDLDELETAFYNVKYKTNWNAYMMYTMLLFKAYEMRFPLLSHPKSASQSGKALSSKVFYLVKTKIQQQAYARAIVDTQMEDYVSKTDELNARIENLSNTSKRRESRYPTHRNEFQSIQTSLEELTVNDFGSNLVRREGVLSDLELELDSVTELALKETRNENIEDFVDLNNRWTRLIPNKKYRLEGIDYKTVSFSKEVIEAFKDQPLVGTRYLAALSKSYVPMKKSSGLRILTSIHKLFRDIKVIKGTTKIRIVGKLVDGTIKFFHVYKSEKTYDSTKMGKTIENFDGAE